MSFTPGDSLQLLQTQAHVVTAGRRDEKGVPSGSVFGDLRVPVNALSLRPTADGAEMASADGGHVRPTTADFGRGVPAPAYGAQLKADARIYLQVLCHANHGSTALEGLFLSSPNLASLCSAGVWECEGGNLMGQEFRTQKASDWDYDAALETFSKYWDLSRPVLFDKTPNLIYSVEGVSEGIASAKLGSAFKENGVARLELAYVMMYRPTCLWQLSSHDKKLINQYSVEADMRQQLVEFEQLVEAHEYLTSKGYPIIVVNLGDLIWSSLEVASRLEDFLPYLGKLDAKFAPKLGKDVFEGNGWKAVGSVYSFGQSVSAAALGYDVKRGECTDASAGFGLLPKAEGIRGEKAEAFLHALSH